MKRTAGRETEAARRIPSRNSYDFFGQKRLLKSEYLMRTWILILYNINCLIEKSHRVLKSRWSAVLSGYSYMARHFTVLLKWQEESQYKKRLLEKLGSFVWRNHSWQQSKTETINPYPTVHKGLLLCALVSLAAGQTRIANNRGYGYTGGSSGRFVASFSYPCWT